MRHYRERSVWRVITLRDSFRMEKHFSHVYTRWWWYKGSRERSKGRFRLRLFDGWLCCSCLSRQPACILPCAHLVILVPEEDLRGNTVGLVERGVRLNASANSFQHTAVRWKKGRRCLWRPRALSFWIQFGGSRGYYVVRRGAAASTKRQEPTWGHNCGGRTARPHTQRLEIVGKHCI